MTKRILALALVLGLLCALAGAVYAEETEDAEAPEIITYTGTGDDVIEVDLRDGYAMHITVGPAARSYDLYSVEAYTADGELVDRLASGMGSYDGVVFDGTYTAAILLIEAACDWSVELVPLSDLPMIRKGEPFTGTGDMVLIADEPFRVADVSGNGDRKYFGVWSYWEDGRDLLVNSTDPVDTRMIVKGSPRLLAVSSTGAEAWSITISDPR